MILQLVDKVWFKHLRSFTWFKHIESGNVPTSNLDVNWIHHWKQFFDRSVYVLNLAIRERSNTSSTSCWLSKWPVKVRFVHSLFSFPRNIVFMSKQTGGKGGAVISTKAYHHQTKSRYLRACSDGMDLFYSLKCAIFFVQIESFCERMWYLHDLVLY